MALQQNDLAKGRVNIHLDVGTDEQGEYKELPFKCLVLGEFAPHSDDAVITNQQCIEVTTSNINHVMHKLAPSLQLECENHLHKEHQNLNINLQFTHLKDFSPDNIIDNVPKLKALLLQRKLLKELKILMQDNRQLRLLSQQLLQPPHSDEQGGSSC